MKKTASKVATVPSKPAPVSTSKVDAPKAVTLTRSTKERKGTSVVFLIPGVRGTVKVARTAFAGEPPTILEVVGQPFAPPVVKTTKEERAAARAAMTPFPSTFGHFVDLHIGRLPRQIHSTLVAGREWLLLSVDARE